MLLEVMEGVTSCGAPVGATWKTDKNQLVILVLITSI